MKRITIVGVSNCGKTCYFYGMMRTMIDGMHGFQLRLMNPDDFIKINQGIKRLSDISLPLSDRFPNPSSGVEKYDMELMYGFSGISQFQWVDYPGEYVSKLPGDFMAILADTSCLLVCVDGSLMQGTAADVEDIIDDIRNDCGREVNNALLQAANINGGLPPVCVIITKYDMVSQELKNEACVEEIIQGVFSSLFTQVDGKAQTEVMICPVSLGKDILSGGRMRPKYMEKPICFANYVIFMEELRNYIATVQTDAQARQAAIDAYNNKGILERLISEKPVPLTPAQAQAIDAALADKNKTLDALRGELEAFSHYVNGVKKDWT